MESSLNRNSRRFIKYATLIFIGLAVGIAVAIFAWAFHIASSVLDKLIGINKFLLLVTVPLGMFAAFMLVELFAQVKRTGSGTHSFLEAYHFLGGYATAKDTFLKASASALTIGLGGSAGLEGPSLTIGGGVASWIARALKVREDKLTGFFLAGAAAGLSAIFRAPLTGILFALEIPYKRDLEREFFVEATIASISSYLVFTFISGTEQLFPLHLKIQAPSIESLTCAIAIGVLAALTGRLFIKTFLYTEKVARAVGLGKRGWALPIVGGLILALIGLFEPRVLGVGYETIRNLMTASWSDWRVPATLLVLKILATSITLNFGGSGGLFIPSIYVGAALGALFSSFIRGSSEAYTVIGMGAVLAATQKTLLTSVVFTAETSGPSSIIPTLVAATVSYFLSGSESFYGELQLVRRPENKLQILREIYSRLTLEKPVLLNSINVGELAEKPKVILNGSMSVEEAIRIALGSAYRVYPIVDNRGVFQGFVSLEDLLYVPERSRSLPIIFVSLRQTVTLRPTDSLGRAIEAMLREGMDKAAVVDEDGKLIGMVAVKDMLRAVAGQQ